MKFFQPWTWLKIAWAQAIVGTLVSLYASEILGLIPCVLCWYQRIALYPLAIILGIALWRKDTFVYWYGLPLSIIGAVFALYHSLLQWGLMKEVLFTCVTGIPCSQVLFNFLGFINFPFLSFLGFSVIIFCLSIFKRSLQSTKSI